MCAKKKTDDKFEFEEKIVDASLSKAIHNYMIPYSEYVILDRALPRVEDGLKPVQRRVLYTMYEMGLKPEGETKKSARIVGNCMGQYHPHGDSSIYNAMVVLAQNFKTRNALVYGQGNFGSVDGDGAAAMRYTEAKLEPLGFELMRDIDKDTIPWSRNYDDSQDEPEILPGRFPNLLVNGCPIGIAVGLTTKIPPHNLSEVIDGVIAYINNPNISTKELMNYIKGPDFPTGGFIENTNLLNMYETGEGKFVISAKYDIEIVDNDKQNIVITELPYDVNKAKLCQEIKDLRDSLREKTGKENILAGITEISDESNKNGIRVVIRLKKGENATEIVKFLFAKTKLKISYNAVFVAVVGGKPEQLSLNSMIKHYVNHQRTIILNSHKFDCNKAKKRAHILEGFMIVHPDIREVCDIVIESKTEAEAKSRLKARFSISEAQTEAILSTKLRSLTKMEITKLEKELAELKREIAECERIINSKTAQMEYLKKDLLDMKNTYRIKRQTTIVGSIDSTFVDPLSIGEKNGKAGFVVIYNDGKVGFINPRQYHNARKSAEVNGAAGLAQSVTEVASGDNVLLFTNFGNCIKLKTDELQEKRWAEESQELKDICRDVSDGELPVNVVVVPEDDDDGELFFFTKNGQGKRGKLSDYVVNKEIYQAMILKEGDEVISVEKRRDETGFVLVTKQGMYVNLNPDDFSATGRKSGGVGAINISAGDELIFASQAEEEEDIDGRHPIGEVLLVTSDGFAKRLIMDYIGKAKRNGKGDRIITFSSDDSFLRGAFVVTMSYDLAIADDKNAVSVINTEDIMVENKRSKGKPIGQSVSVAVRDVSDT